MEKTKWNAKYKEAPTRANETKAKRNNDRDCSWKLHARCRHEVGATRVDVTRESPSLDANAQHLDAREHDAHYKTIVTLINFPKALEISM